ncbi:hypothetical protein AJ78_07164 [Emergomyces pasteurianus Ep9510]|uniref:Nephrocystin 3-like N-terminal domain-containing protein n=1 Tax=Emergomyces pasteurianus Ep9510 TaxID=1447872 RepID=A0A1J9QAK0_9EURO|nr:hypothetical protein AJ78_07164 [Emergomyces pasteurianus Ep9510]
MSSDLAEAAISSRVKQPTRLLLTLVVWLADGPPCWLLLQPLRYHQFTYHAPGNSEHLQEAQKSPGDADQSDVVERRNEDQDRTGQEAITLQLKQAPQLHNNDKASIDIVTVHGPGANPKYAWMWLPKNNPPGAQGYQYPKEKFNWLKQLLPQKLPSRVMAFNYDSDWYFNAPQQKLSSISDKLLERLRSERKVIVSASQSKSEYNNIAESMVGVVFMGTPHRGRSVATWGSLVTSLAPPGFVTEDRLLKDLELQSNTLIDRLYDFTRWLFVESVPVVCFYEKRLTDYSTRMGIIGKAIPLKYWCGLVVPETSACIDGHQKICLEADHFKTNKFYGHNDPSFQLIYPCIDRIARGSENMLERRRNPKIIPMDQSTTSGYIRTCLQQMGLLRILGSPGIGKTMMSTFLAEVLKGKVEKSSETIFAYFFYDDKVMRFSVTSTQMLSNTVIAIFEVLFDNFSSPWRVFQDMLRDDQAGEVFILIDAPDECERSTRTLLLVALRELLHAPQLDDAQTGLRMDSSNVNADLSAYIDVEVEELAQRRHYSKGLKDGVKQALAARAGGTFLWDLPKGLDETYATILKRAIREEDRQDARFLLFNMVAHRPFKRKEIAGTFALWKTGTVLSSQSLEDSACSDRTNVFELLLGTGQVDVNIQDSDGKTPLSWAANYGFTEVVKMLLATG